jgi:hypothetical protein
MQIDLEHLHYWMCAIRESEDPNRTLDAFWRGQISSKAWLISNLRPFIDRDVTIEIHGGWVGVLASMLFQSGLPVTHITSIDIDSSCEKTAYTMNKGEEITGKFKAITADMCTTIPTGDVIINTSCEHITQEQYEQWLFNIPKECLLVLQSNNYNIEEHIRVANSLEHFVDQSNLTPLFSSQLELPLYTRYMIIAKK